MTGNERKEKDNAIETKKSEMVDSIIKILVDGNLTVGEANQILSASIQKIKSSKLLF